MDALEQTGTGIFHQGIAVKKLSILIPVYNEEITIGVLLKKIIALTLPYCLEKEVILINDGSTDNSKHIMLSYQQGGANSEIKYLEHSKNRGKGAAIHSGLAVVSGDLVMVQDADLEYCPEEYHLLIAPIWYGAADVVYGSRYLGKTSTNSNHIWQYRGNRFLTQLSNRFTGLQLSDMETGYKLFKTTFLKAISLSEKRFGFEPEVTAKISKIPNIRIAEAAISYHGRTYKEGKKIGWKDGVWATWCILWYSIIQTRTSSNKLQNK